MELEFSTNAYRCHLGIGLNNWILTTKFKSKYNVCDWWKLDVSKYT